MTPFSGDEYEPVPAYAAPEPDYEPAPAPRRSFAPRRPWAARTWYRPAPGTPCFCGCPQRTS
ncbi:hypothetical protein ACIA8K_06490 [Catenuloplanes sp. NPDC051500]|uniref:hypothetical protein n=1 Tax=Catenuloplanes sp. NPDC051500 TaxID=3363959 RepID=UPI00378B3542